MSAELEQRHARLVEDKIARLRAENEQQRDMLLECARQRRELEAENERLREDVARWKNDAEIYQGWATQAEAQLAVAVGALQNIEGGNFGGISTMVLAGNWRGVVTMFQEVARNTLCGMTDRAADLLAVVDCAHDVIKAYPIAAGPIQDSDAPNGYGTIRALREALAKIDGTEPVALSESPTGMEKGA